MCEGGRERERDKKAILFLFDPRISLNLKMFSPSCWRVVLCPDCWKDCGKEEGDPARAESFSYHSAWWSLVAAMSAPIEVERQLPRGQDITARVHTSNYPWCLSVY